jgi:oligopeptide/dipeptide ABC transporter ATP-binding protein
MKFVGQPLLAVQARNGLATVNAFRSTRARHPSYHVLMPPLIELRGLTVEIPTPAGWIRPVSDVSFALEKGESLGLVGESGSGKSMLALALMGLLPPGARARGEAWLAGASFTAAAANASGASSNGSGSRVNLLALSEADETAVRGRDIAMIFQEPMTALNPVMRVGAQIAEAVRAHDKNLSREEMDRRVTAALERAAVPQPELRARQYPHQLSGGLRQRAMIAMALAGGNGSTPRLLIADEPTTALDVTVQKQILDLLAELRRDLGLTLLFITHDLGVVARVADRIAVAYAGRIVEEGPAREVLERPRHPYTAGLLRASPQLVRHKLEPIAGSVPSLTALPPGCAFEPRCPVRIAECAAAMPELREAGPGHRARCVLVGEKTPRSVGL